MVSTAMLALMGVSVLLAFGTPVLLYFLLFRRTRCHFMPVLAGVAGFFVTQIVVRMTLLQALSTQGWFVRFAQGHFLLYVFLLALSAGLFETAGRYATIRWMCKGRLTAINGIAHGIGHGGIEAWYLGLNMVSNLILCLSLSSGAIDPSALPEAAQAGVAVLLATPASQFLAAGVERVLTIFCHIALSELVMLSVSRARLRYAALALGLHTLLDFAVVLVNQLAGAWAAEAVLALFAVGAIALTRYLMGRFPYPKDALFSTEAVPKL